MSSFSQVRRPTTPAEVTEERILKRCEVVMLDIAEVIVQRRRAARQTGVLYVVLYDGDFVAHDL